MTELLVAGAGVALLTAGTVFPDLIPSTLTFVLLKADLSLVLESVLYIVRVLVFIPEVIPDPLESLDLTKLFPFVDPLEIPVEGRLTVTELLTSLSPLILEVTAVLVTVGL